MGLIVDTSILIASERRRVSVPRLIEEVQGRFGDIELWISSVSVVELTHGKYRARSEADRDARTRFIDDVLGLFLVYPLTVEIASLAGRIEGEQAAVGNVIEFEDLIIGATAVYLGFDVATLNVRHFQAISGVSVVSV